MPGVVDIDGVATRDKVAHRSRRKVLADLVPKMC